jgi:hypothetical protein
MKVESERRAVRSLFSARPQVTVTDRRVFGVAVEGRFDLAIDEIGETFMEWVSVGRHGWSLRLVIERADKLGAYTLDAFGEVAPRLVAAISDARSNK